MKRLIIRVPMYKRDWRVPLKEELGMDYRLDPTHNIEYTKEEFFRELKMAKLEGEKIEFIWGEIWSVVRPFEADLQESYCQSDEAQEY